MRCRSVVRHARRVAAIAAGAVVLAVLATGQLAISPAAAQSAVLGLDVSDHQHSDNWSKVASAGARFAFVKATEGTGFVNSDFAAQYDGAYRAGLIRGAYHFALPTGWNIYTFWQCRAAGAFPGDQDIFNGTSSQLRKIATNG